MSVTYFEEPYFNFLHFNGQRLFILIISVTCRIILRQWPHFQVTTYAKITQQDIKFLFDLVAILKLDWISESKQGLNPVKKYKLVKARLCFYALASLVKCNSTAVCFKE